MPMIAFIGVRISWLMLARNIDFAAVASSAFCLASTICLSCCFRIVTSRTDTATCAGLRNSGRKGSSVRSRPETPSRPCEVRVSSRLAAHRARDGAR